MNSKQPVSRRKFISSTAATTVAGAAIAGGAATTMASTSQEAGSGKFKLKFAPHPGSFKSAGKDVVEQIKHCHNLGFTAFEHSGLGNQSIEEQQRVGDTLEKLGMTMGVFVAYANFVEPTFAKRSSAKEKEIVDTIKKSVDVAKRARAKWMTVVPGGIDQPLSNEKNKYGGARLAEGYQMANVIDLLRRSLGAARNCHGA
jgi:hydroxypyruvate isomerase